MYVDPGLFPAETELLGILALALALIPECLEKLAGTVGYTISRRVTHRLGIVLEHHNPGVGHFLGQEVLQPKTKLVVSLVPGLSWCAHESTQWPFRPWTATMLFISNHH